jgi:class 3 adenylate cyclase
MVVGGAPIPCDDHAERTARFAIGMMQTMEDFNKKNNQSMQLRIGMNTGEAVAAVVGTKKFTYDLWSDAVNIAARMESHGEPGRIHLTENLFEVLKDSFSCCLRGEVSIKGKGSMKTYFLEA